VGIAILASRVMWQLVWSAVYTGTLGRIHRPTTVTIELLEPLSLMPGSLRVGTSVQRFDIVQDGRRDAAALDEHPQ
jgi:hypothetical protein